MPRIRTVKPEFWEDEVVGLLPRDARLLFIATFNMADDEGLLRWTPAYIKANAFMYDDDLTTADVDRLMNLLTDAGLLYPYVGGVARQQMAVVVNFRKHQRVNRPQKSKLPPPSLQNLQVRKMYARRDGWACALCGGPIPRLPVHNDCHNLSIDHIRPISLGGTDHPSNVRATHQACNKSRGNREGADEFVPPRSLAGLEDSVNDALSRSGNSSLNDSVNAGAAQSYEEGAASTPSHTQRDIYSVNEAVNDSLNHSLPEGKGREGSREGRGTPPTPRRDSLPVPAESEKGLPDRMLTAWWDKYGRRTAQSKRTVRQAIVDALGNGIDSSELWAAMDRLGDLSKPISGGTLQFALADIRKTATGGTVVPFRDRQQQQTDDWYERAMARAAARDAQEQQ